jgi:phosphate-selective porin
VKILRVTSLAALLAIAGAAGVRAVDIDHGDKGFELRSADGNHLMQIQARVQLRYAYPWDSDPVTLQDFDQQKQHVFKVNRARLKVGGHAHDPDLKYYFEYELASNNLLDFRVMVERYQKLSLKAGQWKVDYSRERIISSGKQQLADRSLVNRPFTIDRQQGVALFGWLRGTGAADFSYWAGVFTGTGRGSRTNDDEHLMWAARLQWNALGGGVPFSGSDIKRSQEARAGIAAAAVTNRSPYTRFSQEGGGQLEGYEEGEPGQYRVNQWTLATAFMYSGFSWQQEYHWKRIDDRVNGVVSTLTGNYAQLGYFLHGIAPVVPEPLELALRYAFYNPDQAIGDDMQQEFALAANWFFRQHLNKLTAEISYFDFEYNLQGHIDGWRIRLQWDVSV